MLNFKVSRIMMSCCCCFDTSSIDIIWVAAFMTMKNIFGSMLLESYLISIAVIAAFMSTSGLLLLCLLAFIRAT